MYTNSFFQKVSTLVLALILTTLSIQAQVFEDRVNFGALLEPTTGVVHGAGQSADAFQNYWEAMDEDKKPSVYMFYVGLNSVDENWYVPLKKELLERKDVLIIPQIGLSMTNDGSPEEHYEDDVANGDYDEQIEMLIQGFKELGSPAYLRIGFEFNGVTWNGYVPNTYIEAFRRIATKIKEANLEVATVWCVAIDGATNYFDYYPGDEYVDWFGVDTFTKGHFLNSNTKKFLDSASVHQKPVMIGESTPRGTGSKDGQTSWDNWFADYFKFIKENPEIKLTNYINWNWAEYPQWSDWGDARIEDSGLVNELYNGEKDSSAYIHVQTESSFRSMLGYEDDQAPTQVQNFKNNGEGDEVKLSWDSSSDASGIARYKIYKNDDFFDFTLMTSYTDRTLEPSETYTYKVVAVDRSGNESIASETVSIETSNTLEKIINGDFDDSTNGWDFSTFEGAEGSFSIATDGGISGDNSGLVEITNSTGTNWNIQLRQSLNLSAGSKYEIKFKAKANKEVSFITVMQQVNAPYTIYNQETFGISTTPTTFTTTFEPEIDDVPAFTFFLGDLGEIELLLDNISVKERVLTVSNEEEGSNPTQTKLSPAYPNPFNPTTNLSINLPEASYVELSVYDMLGRKVQNLVEGIRPAGANTFQLNASSLSSGVYLVRLINGNTVQNQKITLLK